MNGQVIVAERCNWCSHFEKPGDLLPFPSGQRMCQRCYEWHHHALAVLSGETAPCGCQECGLTLRQLNGLSNGPTTRMYVVPKDGIYAVLCLVCKEAYCRKRPDLYKGTRFGQELKL